LQEPAVRLRLEELGLEQPLLVLPERTVQPERHILGGTVLTPERHTMDPLEHRPVHTRRALHSSEPLMHTPGRRQREPHSLV
jgi:hypothetical protein